MNVLLISTYELGRQPFGLASPAAILRAAGHEVKCADLAVDKLPLEAAERAGLVAFHLAMHTATKLAVPVIELIRRLNPAAHICCYGLYAPVNEAYLRGLGVQSLLGGEFENELLKLAGGDFQNNVLISLDRIGFVKPDRSGLPNLASYAQIFDGTSDRITGYTETTRGCKHLCRHCPVVPVYHGKFRAVPADVVMLDIRQQVAAGAQHITFGDPDFFNGPAHGLRIVEQMRAEFPQLTWDATIKIEHLLQRRDLLPTLKNTGCLMVTSAVESVDDAVLARLEKGHTRADFREVVGLLRQAGLNFSPTLIPFTPWTSLEDYRDLLRTLVELELTNQVAPVQLGLRLLIPGGSRLLDLDEVREIVEPFQPEALVWPWRHRDPAVDQLAERVLKLVDVQQKRGASRAETFAAIWAEANPNEPCPALPVNQRRAVQMSEPWYCCAEPILNDARALDALPV
jgi:radical SAM superfamily enzyme YgiQ (UPF0313 family)